MANCNSIKLGGIAKSCEGNIGGIKRLWMIADGGITVAPAAIERATKDGGEMTIKASEITLTGSETFLAYHFAKNTGSLTSTLTSDVNGIRYSNALNLQFNRMEGKKHLEIQAIATDDVQILVMDKNNKLWLCGVDNAATLADANITTGETDALNGYTTTITAVSQYLPFEVDITSEGEAEAFAALVEAWND